MAVNNLVVVETGASGFGDFTVVKVLGITVGLLINLTVAISEFVVAIATISDADVALAVVELTLGVFGDADVLALEAVSTTVASVVEVVVLVELGEEVDLFDRLRLIDFLGVMDDGGVVAVAAIATVATNGAGALDTVATVATDVVVAVATGL